MKRFSETLPYRRVKYAILLCFIAILAYVTMLILSYILNAFKPKYMDFLWQILLITPTEKPTKDSIYLFVHDVPWWLKAWFFYGGLLFFFEAWRSVILRYFGWLIVAWQRFRDSGKFASGGNARFSGLFEDFHAMKDKGIYLGRSLFSPKWSMYDDDDRHMLTIAGSRSGKGATAIIPTLLEWEGSVLCIDPKGTNLAVTKRARHKICGQHGVYFIDPFQVYRLTNEAACFNPLSIIDPSNLTVVEDVRLISEALVPNETDGKNVHFTEGAKTLLDGYIVHVVTSGDYDNPSLIDVYNIVNMTAQQAIDIHTKMFMNESCGGLAKQAAARVMDGMGTNEFGSVVATLKTNLKWLASEAFKETLSRSDFSFEQMKNTPMSVFVVIPPDLLVTHKRFIRLFVNIASSRYTRGGKAKVQGLFIIDECPALGYMEEIAKAYGELASYNLIMWTFFQDKGQLNDIYGTRAQTFIGSSRAVQIFSIDDSDAEWAAGMIGTRGAATSADNTVTTDITAFRDAGSIKTEIGSKGGLQYILRAGLPPMILQRTPYFKSFYFQDKALLDPDHPNKNMVQSLLPFYTIITTLFNVFYTALKLPFSLLGSILLLPRFIAIKLMNKSKLFIKDSIQEGAEYYPLHKRITGTIFLVLVVSIFYILIGFVIFIAILLFLGEQGVDVEPIIRSIHNFLN